MQWVEELARRRQPEDERLHQDAFLAEIAAHTPAATRQFASRLEHLRARVDHGPVTLAQVGVAGVASVIGVLIVSAAGTPTTPRYDCDPVAWAQPMLALGMVLLGVECVRQPRLVQRSTGTFVAFVLLAAGCLATAATADRAIPVVDELLVAGTGLIGMGALSAGVGLWSRFRRAVRVGLTTVGIGAVGIFLSGGAWVAIYMADADGLHAVGCFATAAGSLIMANGFLASRPEIRLRPAH